MKGVGIGLVVIVVIAAIMGLSVMGTYNRLVQMDESIKAAWAQIDNQLQRRADLIPNLVNTVKGYAAHEREIMTHLADARARLAGARTPQDAIAANEQLSGALARLLVIVEQYPQLKADQTFIRLMDELAGTENRIAVERRRYNEEVQAYNQARRRFPGSLVAGLFGFGEAAYFEVAQAAREAPRVDFGAPTPVPAPAP
ncbi:MAG: LemA family protein [Nitrospiria bacterium]